MAPKETETSTTKTLTGKDVHVIPKDADAFPQNGVAGNYKGFLNLMILLLIISHFRLILLNIKKYGVLWRPWQLLELNAFPGIVVVLLLNINILSALLLEKCAWRFRLPESAIQTLNGINVLLALVVPTYGIESFEPSPVGGIVAMISACCVFMKLWSLAHVNHQLRIAARGPKKESSASATAPQNLSLQGIYRFMLLPTLSYEVNFPPNPVPLRRWWLVRRVAESFLLSTVVYIIGEQYIFPLVKNSIDPIEKVDVFAVLERLLKLAIPNMYIWLLGFYVTFHLNLNILAEVFNYGNRVFYKDWWNATTVEQFWNTWNQPVHVWMARHIYRPLRGVGVPSTLASFTCFFISAVLHELVISVPFHEIKLWAFFGMMAQIPLIYLTRPLRGKTLGNIVFWISMMLGQPLVVLLYFRDLYTKQL